MIILDNRRDLRLKKKHNKFLSDITLCIPFFSKEINSSSILRSAEVFGVKNVVIIGRAPIYKYQTVGVEKWLSINRYNSYTEFYSSISLFSPLVIADVYGDIDLPDFIFPRESVLVFGSEDGLQSGSIPETWNGGVYRVKIPQYGFCESLNVGCACAIFLYQYRQQWENYRNNLL